MTGRVRRRGRRGWTGRLLDGLLAVALLGLLVLLAARLDRGEPQTLSGSAVVNDGDTITLGEERIRLRGIDAPEFNQVCVAGGKEYACGRRSRDALVALVGLRRVNCSGREHDKFGRLLAVCHVGDIDLNRRQVEAGWAVSYGDYHAQEDAARIAARGMWAGSFDSPREWRDMHGGMAETEHASSAVLDWLSGLVRFF
ncbi:MAG: thermonuclease family protein [Rhizobiaceae bacterium]|nr:thermonuclease family protein [Rhizobiaceae bacterium]